jgi:hypothetical protein
MESITRAKWLATVIASFPRKALKLVPSPRAGDCVGGTEGIAAGAGLEANAWLDDVLKECEPRDPR